MVGRSGVTDLDTCSTRRVFSMRELKVDLGRVLFLFSSLNNHSSNNGVQRGTPL